VVEPGRYCKPLVRLLEVLGYTIEYKTGGDWIVSTPTGEKLSSSAKVEVY